MRGLLGNTIQGSKTERYKFDALEYYKMEIDWFGFIFIFFALDLIIVWLLHTGAIAEGAVELNEEGSSLGDKIIITETYLLYVVVFARVI